MKQKTLFQILRIAVLILIVYFVFGRNLPAINDVLRLLPLPFLLGLLALGMVYYLLEGFAYCLAFLHRNKISLKQGFTLSMLGMFANVTTAGVGAVPLQTFYLYKQGIDAGNAAGTFLFSYVLHKFSVILLAAGFSLFAVFAGRPDLSTYYPYMIYGFGTGILICVLMCAAALNKRLNAFAHKLICKMPDRYGKQRDSLLKNLDLLQEEVSYDLKDLKTDIQILLVDVLKFLTLCLLPALICRKLGYSVSFPDAMLYMALILALSGSLPNVSGMGPIEFAFLLFYGPVIGNENVAGLLLVYRLANYFFPFLISLIIVMFVRKDKNG